MSERTAVILDTDIGSDIDDAVCLAYLLRQPRCELVGITTVSGREPRERASLADAVCRAAGRTDIPIHSGASVRGDTGAVVQPDCPQAAILSRHPHRPPGEFAPNTAVQYLHETISRRPGEITLLAIGPMTNLGLLFNLDPEIPKKLKALVLMCGVFTNRLAGVGPCEWNALCDPWAAHTVYRSATRVHRSVGLDVTMQVKLPAPEAVQRFRKAGGALNVVADACDVWRTHCPDVVFHDPLAATALFNDRVCTWERGQISVELASQRVMGQTHWKGEANGPHEVALGVDAKVFFDEYFGVVGGATRQAAG
ncbi:MAG: nucleoside hydrolase [Planctomycetes bacterium]|nr:nucleoside hydrolase [Planctomycetota bacterium]